MTSLNYFQRYSQREDHITNNILLMLRHLYRESPKKLEIVLNSLLDIDTSGLNIGVDFKQQISNLKSRPDGHIIQTALDLRIEVKPHSGWSLDQLKNHAEGFLDRSGLNILLLLSTDSNPNLHFTPPQHVHVCASTFEDVAKFIDEESVIAPHEIALREIYNDFYEILASNDLLPNPYLLFAFGCAQTMDWNLVNQAYYEPADRPTKVHVLNGFYGDKSIQAIAKPTYAVVADFDEHQRVSNMQLEMRDSKETVSQHQVEEWIDSLSASNDLLGRMRVYHYADENFQNISSEGSRFIKGTKGGYHSGVWLNLTRWANKKDPNDIKSIAQTLAGQTFEKDRGFRD